MRIWLAGRIDGNDSTFVSDIPVVCLALVLLMTISAEIETAVFVVRNVASDSMKLFEITLFE
jgi:hypothetical protein